MLETVVRNRVSVNSANKARKPLARHRRFDAATKDYEDLTKEVLALMELEKLKYGRIKCDS